MMERINGNSLQTLKVSKELNDYLKKTKIKHHLKTTEDSIKFLINNFDSNSIKSLQANELALTKVNLNTRVGMLKQLSQLDNKNIPKKVKNILRIKIFDMNAFEIEKQIDLDLDCGFFEKLKEHIEFFERFGITLEVNSISLCDKPAFYFWILKKVYPNYNIVDNQKAGFGEPDFILKEKANPSNTIWIEFKFNKDGLRGIQLDWLSKNKNKNLKVLYIKEVQKQQVDREAISIKYKAKENGIESNKY